MQKHANQVFQILRLLTYLYGKKMGQICQSYDVINIFSEWEFDTEIFNNLRTEKNPFMPNSFYQIL
jgi:hypothetical protein